MRKLTDPDKQLILKLYRETGETTSTLADRYGVSNSTISRLLKSTLPEDEYEYLVSLKRAARTPGGANREGRGENTLLPQPRVVQPLSPSQVQVIEPKQPVIAARSKPTRNPLEEVPAIPSSRRVRKRSSAADQFTSEEPHQLELLDLTPTPVTANDRSLDDDVNAGAAALAEMLGEDLLDEEDEADLEDDEDFDDDEDEEEQRPLVRRRINPETLVQVLPLSAAHLPKTCYLVIDRAAELITRPLRDFADLGQIPSVEIQQRTLPVFDNHRVAKRFSTKRDRVIKIPDSRMLHKARYHLQAKGITRLLIDGQVYSLSTV